MATTRKPRRTIDPAAKDARHRSNIFISYRRDDSAAHARHLFESLAARFGEQRVFFDQTTIEPGATFPKRIETAITASAVMLVVIGQRWGEHGGDEAALRDSKAEDWVRREVELGLRHCALVIPVLVDGATMPKKKDLPASIAGLPTRNAITVRWHEAVAELSRSIAEVTDPGARYDLTGHLRDRSAESLRRNTILTMMEISLLHQGEKVTLDDEDLTKKFKAATKRDLQQTGTSMNEIMYVIDRVGIAGRTARGARRLYTARAWRLKSPGQIPGELEKGRPVVAGLIVRKKWWTSKVTKTGLIEDWEDPGLTVGAILTAIVAFDPVDGSMRFVTQFPDWGERGIGTLTAAAAKRFIGDPTSLYSIEATEAVTL